MHKKSSKNLIYIYLPSFVGGGVERVFVRIANHMHQIGQPITVVANDANGPVRELLSPSIPVIDLEARRTRHALVPLSKLLSRTRPTALISALTYNNFSAILANRRAGKPARIVISERAHVNGVLTDYNALRSYMTRRMIKRLYPLADAITAVSNGTADDLAHLSRIPRSKIQVIMNAPPDAAAYATARRASCPHPWLADRQGPVAVAVGRLEPQKNHALMLDALGVLWKRGVRLRLLLLGDGSMRDTLKSRANANGIGQAIDFVGFVDNPLEYMVRADLFLMTSLWEGYPNALLEAATAGMRIVSTDCAGGGARDILGSNGVCRRADPKAFADEVNARLGKSETIVNPNHLPMQIHDVTARYIDLALGRSTGEKYIGRN